MPLYEDRGEMEKFDGTPILEHNLFEFNDSSIWKSLLTITSEQVLLLNKAGKILFTNTTLFGINSNKTIGDNINNIVPSTYLLILKSNLEEVNKTKSTATFETLFKAKHKLKSYQITVKPILDKEECIKGYALASVETTDLKAAQRKYNYKSNLEKLFLTISTKFINLQGPDIDNGINESLELIGRFTNSEHAFILTRNNKNVNYHWHFNSTNPMDKKCSFKNLNSLLQQTTNSSTISESVLIDAHASEYKLENDCPIFINPMIFEKKHYGALILMGKINGEESWSDDFAKPMALLTNVFINALERKKNSIIEDKRKEALEFAITERTAEIEIQKNKLLVQAKELQQAELLVRKANNKLKKANTALEKTVYERTSSLEKTNQELDRFVYSVSHDIKAPLASVKGLINLIRLSSKDELEHNLELMDRSITKLNGFVEDILAYSRNSRIELNHDIISFEDEIELAAEGLRHMEKADDVKLITSIRASSVPVTDQYRLQSVLKNLFSNAVKYQNPEVKNSWVKIHASSSAEEIKIKVSDNGIGIADSRLGKIFDMFYRASENSSGSGLGLYIVKETVEKLGGTITVTSKENVGSSFELTIPNLA